MAGRHKYEGWVLLLTLVGSLAAVAAISIAEGFVPQADLVLTQGEWEILAVVLYVFAIVIYVFGGERTAQRAVGRVIPVPSFRDLGHRWRKGFRPAKRGGVERATVEA
jgi:hypothetical protein